MKPHWRYRTERWLMRRLARIVLGPRMHVSGLENVALSGPVVLVGNHIATCDPPLITSRIDRLDIFSMAKSEAFRRVIARFFLRGWNAFPVVRHSADRSALGYALRCLAEGHALVMFPEGARATDSALHRAHPGVGFLALRSGAPVVCAAIAGTEKVLRKGRWVPRRAAVELRFGTPFTIPRRHADGRRVTSQEAADLIMAAIAQLLPERYRGVYPAAFSGAAFDQAERAGLGGSDTGGDTQSPASPALPAA